MSPDPFVFLLSRLQFGLTIGFHYIFVPLTLGLAAAIAAMDTLRCTTGRQEWRRSARFWNRFFVLAWFVGMATGYPLRMQLQRQWSGYNDYAREVLHAVMGLEGAILPVMIVLVLSLAFVAHLLPPWLRALARWLLAVILLVQAACIVTMNAWMQYPVGTAATGGTGVQIISLEQIFLSSTAICKVAHTLSAGLLTGAMFVVALSAWFLIRRRHLAVARYSMALALPMAGLSLIATVASGHASGSEVMVRQPMKFAAMEAHWRQDDGPSPLTLIALPDMASQSNQYAMAIPKLMSWLATHSDTSPLGIDDLVARAELQVHAALRSPGSPESAGWRQLYERTAGREPDWKSMTAGQRVHATALASRPNVPVLFVSFRLMVGSAVLLGVIFTAAAIRGRRSLMKGGNRRELRWLMLCLPIPWLATFAGWTLAEVGRQPWVIYEQLTTARATASYLAGTAQASAEFVAFAAAYATLGMIFLAATRWILLRGPERRVWPRHWRERVFAFVTWPWRSVLAAGSLLRAFARAAGRSAGRRRFDPVDPVSRLTV